MGSRFKSQVLPSHFVYEEQEEKTEFTAMDKNSTS